MSTQQSGTAYTWNESDLKDPTLFRVNRDLSSINGRLLTLGADVAALQGNTTAAPSSATGAVASIVTVHANRSDFAAGAYSIGSFLTETDRAYIFQVQLVSNVRQWKWIAGEFYCAQTTIPGDLTSLDAGAIVEVSDYGHRLRWSGTAWGWAPGDQGSGYTQFFDVDPSPATGWHLVDGTANVKYLKHDGTTATINLEDWVSDAAHAAFIKAGSPNAAATAATPPQISGLTEVATSRVLVSAADAATTSSGSINNPAAGTPTTVLEPPFTGGGGGGVVTDPGHQHGLAAANAPIAQPASTEPVRYAVRRPYFRQ